MNLQFQKPKIFQNFDFRGGELVVDQLYSFITGE